jgi:hypothetical protein
MITAKNRGQRRIGQPVFPSFSAGARTGGGSGLDLLHSLSHMLSLVSVFRYSVIVEKWRVGATRGHSTPAFLKENA